MCKALGIFDSGLGGISVLQAVHTLMPTEPLIYVADSAHAPYGGKTEAHIVARSLAVSRFLLEQGAKAIVLACNTATVHAVEQLRAELPVPVIAIEPAVKPAVQLTQSGVIGVLATERTAHSVRLQRLIAQYSAGKQVLVQACPGLVEHVEEGDFDSPALQYLLQRYVQPLLDQGADTLVLGCTHYPFLSNVLRELAGDSVTILETSWAVAQQVQRVLMQKALLCQESCLGSVRFFSNKHTGAHLQSMQCLWGKALLVERFEA